MCKNCLNNCFIVVIVESLVWGVIDEAEIAKKELKYKIGKKRVLRKDRMQALLYHHMIHIMLITALVRLGGLKKDSRHSRWEINSSRWENFIYSSIRT